MNRNFAIPLQIKGSEAELKALQNLLETSYGYQTSAIHDSGYTEKWNNLTTNWAGSNGTLGYTTNGDPLNRVVLQLPQDKELALALAAMRTEGAFEKGETLVIIESSSRMPSIGTLAKVVSGRHSSGGEYVDVEWLNENVRQSFPHHGVNHGYHPWRFRRATKEEIINFYRHGSPTLKSDPLPFVAESRKILGYTVPMDLYKGEIRAGELVRKNSTTGNYRSSQSRVFPPEIVEQWEPVYEEEVKVQELMIGQNKQVVVYVKPGEYIKSEGAKISNVDNLTRLYEYMKALPKSGLPWLVDNLRVNIGCLEVTTDDLKKVLVAYEGGKHE